MQRRAFLTSTLGATAALAGTATQQATAAASRTNDRAYMSGLLEKIASPVLAAIAAGQFRKTFRVELSASWDKSRDPAMSYLECFARLMSGLAPWLSLPDDSTAEGRTRRRLRENALQGYCNSVDPSHADYMLWQGQAQALVDSAFFTSSLLRAPKALWEPLDATTRARIVTEIKGLRRVVPPYNNWLLFAAMNEAFLLSIGEEFDPARIDWAIRKINEWYVGDGWNADGERFHLDYYNSFVMHPMMLGILEATAVKNTRLWNGQGAELRDQTLRRTQRYAEQLERFISPEGAFPPIGRSLTYRTAAFQPLALLAWRKQLPERLPEGQVRAALTAVHKAIFANPTNFDDSGFLTIGFAGHQPTLGDIYSNNGSMYLTAEGFLALGLSPADSFWTTPPIDWTTKKAFANAPFNKDYYVSY